MNSAPDGSTDDLASRLADAERRAAAAEAEVERLNQEVAELREATAPISIFDSAGTEATPALADDGSDQRVLAIALGATAVVAGMVALLALLNGNLFTPFGLLILALTCVLAYAATRVRPEPTEVNVTRGIVYAARKGTTYRFDLRSDATHVDMVGEPGDAYWQVRFHRRNMDPFVVDADMVDPRSFVAQLREYRPAL